jgi:hypothetical protein
MIAKVREIDPAPQSPGPDTVWKTGCGLFKEVRERPDLICAWTNGELLQAVDNCGEVDVICPLPQPRHQALSKSLQVLPDVASKERHSLEEFLLRRQVKARQSGFPSPLEMLSITIWTAARILGWHVCWHKKSC